MAESQETFSQVLSLLQRGESQHALELLQNSAPPDTRTKYHHFLKAVCLLATKREDDAVTSLRTELRNHPDNHEAAALLRPLLDSLLQRPAPFPLANMDDPAFLRSLIGCDDPVILDVGCHEGGEARMFLDVFPRAQVYCFDPDPRVRDKFRVQDTNRCTFFPMAIGDRDGTADLHLSGGCKPDQADYGDWDLSSSINRPDLAQVVWPWLTFDRTVQVPVMRIDSWVERHLPAVERIALLWADVQGAERKLIEGARNTLARKIKYFYTEYYEFQAYEGQPGLMELMELLPGFRITGQNGNNVLFENTQLG